MAPSVISLSCETFIRQALEFVDVIFSPPLQNRYPNRPIVKFEIAALEQMKVTELRLG